MPDRPTPLEPLLSAAGESVPRESVPRESNTASRSAKSSVTTSRILCVREREPSWVTLALAFDSSGADLPRMVWVSTSREALARLRDEPFDCILVDIPPLATARGDDLGPFGLIRALRTSGSHEPVVIVGRLLSETDWADACALDCDVFVAPKAWDSPALGALVRRAIARGEIVRENHRLTTADQRRLVRERDESEHLLAQQRQIISELESLPDLLRSGSRDTRQEVERAPRTEGGPPLAELTGLPTVERYLGLLRSYVLMGSGSLAREIGEMVDHLVSAGHPPQEALQLHLNCVETLLKGLGNRSSRHVVARADLLVVELMTHLAHRTQQAAARIVGTPQNTPLNSPLRNVTGTAGIDLTDGTAIKRAAPPR